MAIDTHSSTWKVIRRKLEQAKQEAIQNLIDDSQTERQRGKLALIEELIELSKTPEREPVFSVDTYND